MGILAYCRRHKPRIAGVLTFDNDFLLLPHGCATVGFNLHWDPVPRKYRLKTTHLVQQDEVCLRPSRCICVGCGVARACLGACACAKDYAFILPPPGATQRAACPAMSLFPGPLSAEFLVGSRWAAES